MKLVEQGIRSHAHKTPTVSYSFLMTWEEIVPDSAAAGRWKLCQLDHFLCMKGSFSQENLKQYQALYKRKINIYNLKPLRF